MVQHVTFPSGTVRYYFDSSLAQLRQLYDNTDVVFITDAHVAQYHPEAFGGQAPIILPAGEEHKTLDNVGLLAEQLIQRGATRHSLLIGVGGGMVTDITGFVASVYMRGIRLGFVPTTLLAMTDAAIGGKNGVNTGLYKNMIGTIRQPSFILYDTTLLRTLPHAEWCNGFAEVIKYGCIFDAALLNELQMHDVAYYQNNPAALNTLIQRCAAWKNKTVAEDENEQGIRKLLNFGHTAGHAIEKLYGLAHGQAVAIGMVIACRLSEQETGLAPAVTQQLSAMLPQYGLPTHMGMHHQQVMEVLKSDKKRKNDQIDYILLTGKGQAVIKPLPLATIAHTLALYESPDSTRSH
jgi:3-dehydroquinate synthase